MIVQSFVTSAEPDSPDKIRELERAAQDRGLTFTTHWMIYKFRSYELDVLGAELMCIIYPTSSIVVYPRGEAIVFMREEDWRAAGALMACLTAGGG